jgi:hypothetical protein
MPAPTPLRRTSIREAVEADRRLGDQDDAASVEVYTLWLPGVGTTFIKRHAKMKPYD